MFVPQLCEAELVFRWPLRLADPVVDGESGSFWDPMLGDTAIECRLDLNVDGGGRAPVGLVGRLVRRSDRYAPGESASSR